MLPGEHVWTPYCGAAPLPHDWLQRWNLDPILLAALAALALGWHLSAARAEPGRRKWFAGGFALLVLLFVSPLCALTSALFSARVVHHVLLTAVAAPLFVLALPARRRSVPGVGLWAAVHALTFWAWHSPALYSAALSSDGLYWLMQLSLLGSALTLWMAIVRASAPAAVAALLATMVQMGLLGALITFAATPLYAPHFATTVPWGLSPLEDQQLAGLIMWAPAAGLYLAAALVIAGRWLSQESRVATR